jgi:protein SCO1/2
LRGGGKGYPGWSNVKTRFLSRVILWLALWGWIAAAGALAVEGPRTSVPPGDEENRRFFTDLEVLTHKGEGLRFYSDILKDKVVLISFFYTNCPTAQPVLVTTFKLQKLLGEQLGKKILFLTVSVDPERDTLPVLREFAGRFNPQEGWLFITGKTGHMDVINRKLGNTLRLPEGHLRLFLLGNLRTGHWMKLPESAPPMGVADGLRALAAEK